MKSTNLITEEFRSNRLPGLNCRMLAQECDAAGLFSWAVSLRAWSRNLARRFWRGLS